MKGILLCGGTGSRLYPLTKVINKHLLPIGNKPMAAWGLEKFVEAGIEDILIISGQEHCGTLISQFGDGSDYNCNLTYRVQSKPGGIAQALALAKPFSMDSDICVILGDNIFTFGLTYLKNEFEAINYELDRKAKTKALVLLKKVNDPERYGVAELDSMQMNPNRFYQIKSIEEKPKQPKTDYAVTGIYFYDKSVYDKISHLKPSKRNELEITDVNNMYIAEDAMRGYILDDKTFWSDAGTVDSYRYVNNFVNRHDKPEE